MVNYEKVKKTSIKPLAQRWQKRQQLSAKIRQKTTKPLAKDQNVIVNLYIRNKELHQSAHHKLSVHFHTEFFEPP